MERIACIVAALICLAGSCLSCVHHTYRGLVLGLSVGQYPPMYLSVAYISNMKNEETEKHTHWIATAWAIDNDHLITAGHYCKHTQELYENKEASDIVKLMQYGSDGHLLNDEIYASIVAIDTDRDMCLLESKSHPFLPLELAESLEHVNAEDPVFTVGAPRGVFPVKTDGYVIQRKAARWSGSFGEMLFLGLNIEPGSSGSPVMLGDKVIGMIVIFVSKPHETCLAVPVHHLHEFIQKHLN